MFEPLVGIYFMPFANSRECSHKGARQAAVLYTFMAKKTREAGKYEYLVPNGYFFQAAYKFFNFHKLIQPSSLVAGQCMLIINLPSFYQPFQCI